LSARYPCRVRTGAPRGDRSVLVSEASLPEQAPHFLANAASRLEQFAWNQGSTGARLTPEPQDIFHFRLRACRSGVGRASQGTLRLLPESHGQNLVLTVLYVLSSLDRALCRAAVCLEPRLDWCTPFTGILRLLPESHGQNLALLVLYVPSSLDSALCQVVSFARVFSLSPAVRLEPRLDWYRTWHIKDSQGQILALTFSQNLVSCSLFGRKRYRGSTGAHSKPQPRSQGHGRHCLSQLLDLGLENTPKIGNLVTSLPGFGRERGEREKDKKLRAPRAPRTHTLGYIGGDDQVEHRHRRPLQVRRDFFIDNLLIRIHSII